MTKEEITNLILLELMAPNPDMEKLAFDISQEERDAIHADFTAKKSFVEIVENIKDSALKQKLLDLYKEL